MARRTIPSSSVTLVTLLVAAAAVGGCRGNRSNDPPIHLQQNMDFQRRYGAQQENMFFADRRAMRPQLPNTIARGELREDDHLYRGMVDGAPARALPLPLSKELLARGRDRFNIYCSRCHGKTGDGNSVIVKRKAMRVLPPSYMEPRLLAQPVGYFYKVISEGVRNMPPYAVHLPVDDRWAIAAYVRALQIAGDGSCEQVPAAVRAENGWSCK